MPFSQDWCPCTSSSSYRGRCGVPGKRNATVHFTATVSSKFARFKSVNYSVWSILQEKWCTKHASLISTTSNIASQLSGPSWITPSLLQLCVSGDDVFQLVWRWAVVISSTAFNSDIRTVCLLIFRSDFLAVVSYDVVGFDTWRSFNSQGKVVTLIRRGGLLLLVWFCITLATFCARITTICLYLPKLYLKHYWSHFFPDMVYNN